MFNIKFLFLNDYFKYAKYFLLFNHLIIYISYLYIKNYYNYDISNRDIDCLIEHVKINGCLTIKFAQWYCSRLSIENSTTQNRNESRNNYILERFSDIFYDNNSVHSFEYTKNLFYDSTGKNIDDVVIFNDIEPISSGSIAQVYDCILRENGRRVALKIKHPDLKYQIYFPKICIMTLIDLFNYFHIIAYFPFNIDNFFDALYRQLDFNEESKNLKLFKNNFSDSNLIIIPESLYNNYDIIIMAYEDGIFYEEIDDSICNTFNKFKINFTLFMFVMQCFLIDGVNHADLHNGNWKVRFNSELNEYQVIIYDAGVVYQSDVKSMCDLIYCYDSNNIDGFIKILIRDKYILNLDDSNRDIIHNLLLDRIKPIIQRPFDFSFIIFEIVDILKKQQLNVDGEFITLIIGISLVEKHFKKYRIMGNNEITKEDEEFKKYDYDLVCYNDYIERINFCDTKKNFQKLSDFFKFTLDTLKKTKRINSFDSLEKNMNPNNIKFLDVGLFSKKMKVT